MDARPASERGGILTLTTLGTFTDVLDGLRPLVEGQLDQLIRIVDLSVGDELQQLLDQGLYNPLLSTAFEMLWTARFECREGRDIFPWRDRLLRATFEAGAVALCSDAVLLWLTLSAQNDLAESAPSLVVRGPLDPDLAYFLKIAEQWRSLGSPLVISVES